MATGPKARSAAALIGAKLERAVTQMLINNSPKPLHRRHLSHEHDIPVAGERKFSEKLRLKDQEAKKRRGRAFSWRETRQINYQQGPQRDSGLKTSYEPEISQRKGRRQPQDNLN